MNARAVGTTVFSKGSKPTKWHCHCIMENGKELFIAIKADTAVKASEKAHSGYKVEYVLDILTPEQMERRKAHLKPSLMGAVINY